MHRFITAILLLTLASNVCLGSEGDDQAKAFADLYASLCIKNMLKLDTLREKLKPMPKLPPEEAAIFLGGHPGDAWPVSGTHGNFVLVLHRGKNFCAVYVRRASTGTARKWFIRLVKHPRFPAIAKQVKNEQALTTVNGQTHTVSYEWSIPSTTRKMLFTLTTASSDFAQIQVLGSAEIISQ